MHAKASLNNLRVSPRKVRLVADTIRGLSVVRAENKLLFLAKKSALPMRKLLLSAVANAENNLKMDKKDLFVKTITVDEGLKLKRWQPKAMGRATPLLKRSSQITIILEEKKKKEDKKVTAPKKVKKAKKEKTVTSSKS